MDIDFNEENSQAIIKEKVIISKQQRNGRKCWTMIDNFADKLEREEIKKFIKIVKKTKCCNGSLQNNNKTVQLQGDQTQFVKEIICDKYDYDDDDVIVKGV